MKKAFLTFIGALVLCAFLIPVTSLFAQQYPKGDFSLYDGQMEISDASWPFNGQEQQLFSTAPIQVKGGKVTMGASFGCTYDFGYGPANGTISISGEGQYDSRAGTISGTFTYTNNISGEEDGFSGTLTTDCRGTFSTPPISAAQATVTVSFSGTVNATTTVEGESVTDSLDWSRDVAYKVAVDSGVRFSDLSGRVSVWFPGMEEGDWRAAKFDMVLPNGAHIQTGVDSHVVLSFPDMTSFVIKPETEIVIEERTENVSKSKILFGKVWVNVEKMLKDGSMKFDMDMAAGGTKGTVFSLEEDGTTSTLKVFEGTVEFESKATGESVQVEAGQTVSADGSGLGKVEDFDAAAEQAEWEALGADFSSGEDEADTGDVGEEDSGGLSAWIFIAIAAGAVIILAVAGTLLFALKRRKGAGAA